MRLGYCQKSDYFSGLKALRSHFLPLDQPKMRFGLSRVSDFSRFAFHFELIFGLLIIQKCHLVEVEKAMFQGLNLFSAFGPVQNAT